ncbi:MAG: hypothetical protein AAGA03_15575 [Planctomycetota bacterium]
MQRRSSVLVLAVVAWMFCLLPQPGCRKSSDDRLPVFATMGKVIYRGSPAVGVQVRLVPKVGSPAALQNVQPVGRTDEQGVFTVRSYGLGRGAPAGTYTVTLHWPPEPSSDPAEAIREQFGPQESGRRDEFGIPGGPRDRLKGRFYATDMSPWTVRIEELVGEQINQLGELDVSD